MKKARKPYLTPHAEAVDFHTESLLATNFSMDGAPNASEQPDGPPELDTRHKYWDYTEEEE